MIQGIVYKMRVQEVLNVQFNKIISLFPAACQILLSQKYSRDTSVRFMDTISSK